MGSITHRVSGAPPPPEPPRARAQPAGRRHPQANGELAIVTSQPRFDIIPVATAEIDAWFADRGFEKITDSAYFRREDNLGVFDAHDKNLVRAGEDLIPFDVIPCHPAGGFLAFIQETLAAGHRLRAVRTVTTSRS